MHKVLSGHTNRIQSVVQMLSHSAECAPKAFGNYQMRCKTAVKPSRSSPGRNQHRSLRPKLCRTCRQERAHSTIRPQHQGAVSHSDAESLSRMRLRFTDKLAASRLQDSSQAKQPLLLLLLVHGSGLPRTPSREPTRLMGHQWHSTHLHYTQSLPCEQ